MIIISRSIQCLSRMYNNTVILTTNSSSSSLFIKINLFRLTGHHFLLIRLSSPWEPHGCSSMKRVWYQTIRPQGSSTLLSLKTQIVIKIKLTCYHVEIKFHLLYSCFFKYNDLRKTNIVKQGKGCYLLEWRVFTVHTGGVRKTESKGTRNIL